MRFYGHGSVWDAENEKMLMRFLTETGDAGSTKAGYLAVTTPAGTKYIQLMTA